MRTLCASYARRWCGGLLSACNKLLQPRMGASLPEVPSRYYNDFTYDNSMTSPTRWGILGAGAISVDFTAAITMLPETEHQLGAVASRDLHKAKEFSAKFGTKIPKVYGSYAEMAQDPDIDVVYIATVHPFHYEPAMMLMEAGKNVLIEKPMSMNAELVNKLIDKSKEKCVFLMEGFWGRFFPIYENLRREISSQTIGDIHTVVINFSSDKRHIRRSIDRELGPGALFTLGCYCLQFVTLIYGGRPDRICASGELAEAGYDLNSVSVLYYKDGRRAIVNCCMDRADDHAAIIIGSKGVIRVPNFWSPEVMITPTKTHECPVPKGQPGFQNFPRTGGFVYQIKAVRDCLLKGVKESPLMTHEHSLINSEIMDEIRRQLGVVTSQQDA